MRGNSENRNSAGALYRTKIVKSMDNVPFGMPSFETNVPVEPKKPAGPTLEQRIAAIEKDAYQKGFSAGERAGMEVGQQKATALLQRLQIILKELAEMKDNLAREIEPGVIKLSIAIARKVIATELTQSPESIAAMVKAALRKVEKTGPVTIKINPAIAELMEKMKPELLSIHPEIIFDIDPTASFGGPLVIGPVDEVVTDIDEQIKEIEHELEVLRAMA